MSWSSARSGIVVKSTVAKILTLSGSLRTDSTNGRLLRHAATLLPASVTVDHYDGLASLPAFDPGLDAEPGPAILDFRRRLKAADAVLISTPEYAHGVPGSLKNALDWVVGSGELVGKPVAVIVASSTDGAYALKALVEVLRTMSATVPDELTLGVGGIKTKLPMAGAMDPVLEAGLKRLLSGLLK